MIAYTAYYALTDYPLVTVQAASVSQAIELVERLTNAKRTSFYVL